MPSSKPLKIRLDRLLVERGLTPSRERARAVILAGSVLVDDVPVDKAGSLVTADARVRIKGETQHYVSRGGLKMEGALDHFAVDLSDVVALDVGASTGGFTDCLLQHGARRVYAIDVGYGQLAWQLRQDDRVKVHERTNIRTVTPDCFDEIIDCAVIDVSFISLRIVLPCVVSLIRDDGFIIALIKPQFEAGRSDVGKGGVVRDSRVHDRVVHDVAAGARELGMDVIGTCVSPLRGPSGNREFFLYAKKVSAFPSGSGT